jgi:ABC-type uncharacterized transport system involved in gliding motility auxiliary subunit
MKISLKTHRNYHLQQLFFYLLLIAVIGLLAKVSTQYNKHWDWTENSRHTLSDTSITLLTTLESPITIKAFVDPNSDLKQPLKILTQRYQSVSPRISVDFIDPNFAPDQVRDFNIQQQGEMIVTDGNKLEHVFDLSEQSLTNAIMSVARSKQQWLLFIEGHGERSPFSEANFNLSAWAQQLKAKGFNYRGFNLAENSQIPTNTAAIILASPEKPWFQGEFAILKSYIEDGGNLLWLAEPNTHHYLTSLAEQLDIEFTPGTIIDPNAELLGINDPQFVLITDYANHPISQSSTSVTLLPKATAIEPNEVQSTWKFIDLFRTQQNTWSETSAINSDPVSYDEGKDTLGPLTAGALLTRMSSAETNPEQRIAVIGDGDFVSNSYLGNGGNLDISLAIVNWLAHDDSFIAIPVKTTLDSQLTLSKTQAAIIGIGFLFVIPIILLVIGGLIWWSRRRR